MNNQYASHTVQVTGQSPQDSSGGDIWVRLEQIMPKEIHGGVNVEQLHALWMQSLSGSSAHFLNLTGCPVEIRGSAVHVFLGFWAWPSSPDLEFNLYASQGEIINRRTVREQRTIDMFVNNADAVMLPYYMESVSAIWLTPTYSRSGEQVSSPVITTMDGTWIELSREVFGVMRVTGTAVGETAQVEIVLDKEVEQIDTPIAAAESWYDAPSNTHIYSPAPAQSLNAAKISNVQCTVTAEWVGEYGEIQTTQLSLETPQCVKDLLGLCPDMFKKILRICTTSYTLYVHYNACSGEVMWITPEDPNRYCSQSEISGPSDYLTEISGWLK